MDDLLSELVSKAGAMSDEELSSLMRQLEVLKSGREKRQERHEVAVDGRLAMPCPHCGSIVTNWCWCCSIEGERYRHRGLVQDQV